MNFMNTPESSDWKLIIFVLSSLVQLSRGSSIRLPNIGPAEVSINVPQAVGGFLGSLLKVNKRQSDFEHGGLQHSFGPVTLRLNFQQQQPYQYTPENYQYVPPPAPMPQEGGYYPYGRPDNQYLPQPGYYGPGYYPVASTSQHRYYPQNQPQHWSQYQGQLPETNPYMRPAYPNGPIMPIDDQLAITPLAPIKNYGPYRSVKKGTILMPDSPLYVHIPEDPPTTGIEPRR